MITAPHIAHRHHNTMDLAPRTPPLRRTGGELPWGRRYAIAMEVALAIPPGKARVPRGSLGPICESYGVGPEFPTKFWENVEKPRWTLPRRSTFGAAKGLDARRSSRQQRLRRCSRASTRSTTDTLERVWQSLVKVYNQTLRTSGDNDFSVEHSGVRAR